MTAPAATPPAPQTVNPDGSAAPSGGNQPGTQKHAGNILPIPPAGTPAPGTPPPTPDPSPAPPTPTPTPAPGNFSFNCAGQQTSDFAAVQSYIAKLEADSASFAQFRAEQTRAVRVDFVKGLATEKKILASQIGETEKGKETGLVAVALGLSDEAFAQFSASYAALPVNPIFANQATGGTDPSNSDVSADEKAYAEAKSRVEWHRSAKRDEEFIKTTDSWKTYERLHVALGKPGSA